MGKPLTQALVMANDCYDRRRELDIVEAIKSLTTWKELTPKEMNSLIQPFSYRDPRLMEVIEWVKDLCKEKEQSGKFD